MKIVTIFSKLFASGKIRFARFPLFAKIISMLLVVGLGTGIYFLVKPKQSKITYETATVTKDTLIQSITGSGTISSGNYTNVTTKASGVVNAVYVTNGDTVTKGQTIAEITLDDYAKERQAAAWASYLDSLEAVQEAQKNKISADLAMWEARQDILDAEEDIDYQQKNAINPQTHEEYTLGEKTILTKTLEESKANYTLEETKYKNADAQIADMQAKAAAALRTYQENAATIIAPESGVISDLMLAQNIVVSSNSSVSNTSGATIVSPQTIAKINNATGQLTAQITLTEVDIITVKANQKVTLTLDAYENASLTGKVLGVNTSGTISSDVTSYPVTLLIDPTDLEVYPNMAVNATIITNMKTDVISIPTTAITTTNAGSTVEIMQNGKPVSITVQTGISNDANTEILSGLAEGDILITATIQPSAVTSTTTASPFSGLGRNATTRSSSSSNSSRSGGTMMQIGGPPGGF